MPTKEDSGTHGTRIAGAAAAILNNRTGISGVAGGGCIVVVVLHVVVAGPDSVATRLSCIKVLN